MQGEENIKMNEMCTQTLRLVFNGQSLFWENKITEA